MAPRESKKPPKNPHSGEKRHRSDPAKSPSPEQPSNGLRPTSPSAHFYKNSATNRTPQNTPASRQSAALDARNYTTYPTSSTQGGQEGDLSGAWPGHMVAIGSVAAPDKWALTTSIKQPYPPPTSMGRSALGFSAQQPLRPAQESPYGPNAPSSEPRLTDWQPPDQPYVPGSSRSGLSPPQPSPFAPEETTIVPSRPLHKRRRGNRADSPWSPAEEAMLKNVKRGSTDWDWEVIDSTMAEKGFNRDPLSFRNRWQDFLRPKPTKDKRGARLSPEEKEMLVALRSAGHDFREISDQFERRGFYRDANNLCSAYSRLKKM